MYTYAACAPTTPNSYARNQPAGETSSRSSTPSDSTATSTTGKTGPCGLGHRAAQSSPRSGNGGCGCTAALLLPLTGIVGLTSCGRCLVGMSLILSWKSCVSGTCLIGRCMLSLRGGDSSRSMGCPIDCVAEGVCTGFHGDEYRALRCPSCGDAAVRVGGTFEVPKRKDERAWERIERMIECGDDMVARFQYCCTIEEGLEMSEEAARLRRKDERAEQWKEEKKRRLQALGLIAIVQDFEM